MNVIYITGRTGAGKSKLLHQARKTSRIAFFDCLGPEGAMWQPPEAQAVDAVAIDHVHWRKSGTIVDQAMAWCRENCKPLCLADNWRSDLAQAVDHASIDVVELAVCQATAVLVDGLASVPIGHWPQAIQAACAGRRRTSPLNGRAHKPDNPEAKPKKIDGRSREARAVRQAAQSLADIQPPLAKQTK